MTEQLSLPYHYPSYLKIPARIFSYLLHPLFIPTYFFLWLTYRFPVEFEGMTALGMFMRKVNVFWITAFFPAFSVFLMWRLKFIESIQLKTQRERIGAYIITMIFYWWMWYLSREFTDQPLVLKFFYLGIFFATVPGLILNSFIKISMHAMGMAGLLTAVLLTCYAYQSFLGADILLITLLTGLVCSSRLLLNDHTNAEIYLGFFVGAVCQLIAFYFVM